MKKIEVKYSIGDNVFVWACGKFYEGVINMIYIDTDCIAYDVKYGNGKSSFLEKQIFLKKEELVEYARLKFDEEVKVLLSNLN